MQSQHAMMPLAASNNSNEGQALSQLQQQQPQQVQQPHQHHQQAMMATAASVSSQFPSTASQTMAGHGSLEPGTGFQQQQHSGSGISHMHGDSTSSVSSNASLQHDGSPAASLAMPGASNSHAQQQAAFPYSGEQQQQQHIPTVGQQQQQQQQNHQQQQQSVNDAMHNATFMFDPNQSASASGMQFGLVNNAVPQQQQQQQFQPSTSGIPAIAQQTQQNGTLAFHQEPHTVPSSARSSPVTSTSNLDTPTVGSSVAGPFAFPAISSSSNGTIGNTNSAPATSAGNSFPSSTSSTPSTLSQTGTLLNNGSISDNSSSAPSANPSGGAEMVGQHNNGLQQQHTNQQSMSAPSTATTTNNAASSQSSPIDAKPSSTGLTLGQMDPQFTVQQQQQIQQQQTQSAHHPQQQHQQQLQPQPQVSAQPLMVHEHLSSAQGQELAVKACADLSNSYNKIADVLRQFTVIDMQTRIRMRQEFCNSVSALDRAFFLSPAGPGYIGLNQDENAMTRKRAYTVNSADGDDSNKHRRTISVTSDGRSDMSGGNIHRSPHSLNSQGGIRPPLGSHTHSSPLLPAESHYRATSAGMDTIPGPKASDMAVSGSHLVGRPVIPTPLYQSVLASDDMLTDALAQLPPQDGIAPSQIQTQPTQLNGGILSPMPIPAPNSHVDLSAMQGPASQVLYQGDMQQSFVADGVDPSNMQIQPSTTPTPMQQQTYVTPPMDSMPQFAAQSGGMQYIDSDMASQDMMQNGAPIPPAPTATPTSAAVSHSGGSSRSRPTTRAGHPGSLDFTTLRPKDDDSVTSPYASSHLSMSSFPFSNSVTSQTSGSRSRATSISRNTSASRSRAPSINSAQLNLAHGPDAQELQNILGSLNAMPSPINEDDDDEEQSTADGNMSAGKREVLSPELLATYNRVFLQWLPRVCADVEATDRKGEKIHQPLMAKKMAKLDEEHAFRPFKFRIQPFTNSFQDACKDLGLSEADTAPKLIKHFLWNQPLISRFNDEGKKTKSRGNHVWSIEARYLAPGHYEFRPPAPKIVPLPATAAPNVPWSWTPKVLDSSCQGPPMAAHFSCGQLPSWLEFRDNVLQGTPPPDALSVMLDIAAEYVGHKLVQTFTIAVVAEDGVRPVANNSPAREEQLNGMQPLYSQTPIHGASRHQGNYSGSSLSSDLTHSTNSIVTPPSVLSMQHNGTLLPSPIPALGLDGHMPMVNGHVMGSKMMPNMVQPGANMAPSPTSPQQAGQYGNQMAQPVPFYLPTHPTDVTTLASANHIKAKLVEATTIHHENMSVLNPSHPPPDPAKVSVAVDAAINRQLAMSSTQPAMPTATEVFNATLEVSTRSQQMQQEQLTHAVSAVTQSIQQPPPLSTQVTSQLANFSFTPSHTPGNNSPETTFIGQQ